MQSLDPVNDVTMWTEHVASDGRKYWHNKATQKSVAIKPYCLKTPDERAIPDCIWTEYSSPDGRKYYSAEGKGSVWVMPEEFRAWREAMDALEAKKALPPAPAPAPASASVPVQSAAASDAATEDGSTDPRVLKQRAQQQKLEKQERELPVFSSKAEAAAAFKTMLRDRKVPLKVRLSDGMASARKDPKWPAFARSLTPGERNQAFSEYQTGRMKEEREAARVARRRNRDAFLLLLAETVEIDANSRWRECIELLKHDARYKAVAEPQDREEMFAEWVEELGRKLRTDRAMVRDTHRKALLGILEDAAIAGTVTRKSTWRDCRNVVIREYHALPIVSANAVHALDEADVQRCAMDYISLLEDQYKDEARARRDAAQQTLKQRLQALEGFLESWLGTLSPAQLNTTQWRDIVALPDVKGAQAYLDVQAALHDHERLIGPSSLGPRDAFGRALVLAKAKPAAGAGAEPVLEEAEEGEEDGVGKKRVAAADDNSGKSSRSTRRR